jgi:hypothetical protein
MASTLLAVVAVTTLAACGGDSEDAQVDTVSAQPASATGISVDNSEAQLAELEAMFPITVDASLDGYDLVGGYTMSLTEAYCDGLPDCGVRRPDVHADIIQGANGLELQIPTVLTAGLFSVEGSLFAVTDSDLIAAPCGATPRNARISITMFADGVTLESDGSRELAGLGASLLVEANQVAECGEGVIFFAADFIPD